MQGDLQGSGRCLVLKRLWWILVELPKTPSVVGLQGLFEKAEDVQMAEEVKVDTCGTT